MVQKLPFRITFRDGRDFCSDQISLVRAIQPSGLTAIPARTNKEDCMIEYNKQQQPLETYMVEAEITEIQKRLKGIEERAEF